MNKQTIGLMMVVRNEAKRIKECLEWHLPYVDQVVICDQESDDGTLEIVKECLTKWNGDWQVITDKQWGYCEPSKQKAADLLITDWILYVDADEKFPQSFLEDMHEIVKTDKFDGFRFPRYNYFSVQVFGENVPIKPKWITVLHPAKDPQLRLTRRSLSIFPIYLHNRVRIFRADGKKYMQDLPFPIEHRKTVTEQWDDEKRYKVANGKGESE